MDADLRMTLKAAVMRLDPADRLIVLLHYADGLTLTEIAGVLDRPSGEVAGRLAQLRWRLGRVLGDAAAANAPAEVSPSGGDRLAVSG